MRLLLSHGRLERKRHLRVVLQGKNTLAFKKHANRMGKLREHPNHTDTVHHISRKPGYALRDDHIDFSSPAVRDHLMKLVTVSKRGAADSFIRIDPNQDPIGVTDDKIFIVLFLQLIGSCLLKIPCGYTGVDGNTLEYVIIIVIDLLFGRNKLVILRIDFSIDTAPYTLLLVIDLPAGRVVNHGAHLAL